MRPLHSLLLALPLTIFAVNGPQSAIRVLQPFEGDGFDGWQTEGDAFGLAPAFDGPGELSGKVQGYGNESFACSGHGGVGAMGKLVSPEFEVTYPYCSFLLGGAKEGVAIELLKDGHVVRSESGQDDFLLRPHTWNVEEFRGQKVSLRLRDDSSGGLLLVDHIQLHTDSNPAFPAATRHGQPYEPGLVPTDIIAGMTIPEGTVAKIFANHEEHGVTSPTALSIAENNQIILSETHRFRLGVEDNRDHLYWVLDDIASISTEDRRALHEKWNEKRSIEILTSKSEFVRSMFDSDGDGTADQSKVLAEGFNDVLDGTAAGILSFEGTVYLACIPSIWMLRDADGDGTAEERVKMQSGFGVRVSLSGHDMNGFALGPDGRIYGSIGDRGLSLTTKEGVEYILPQQGAAFRFDPDGSHFEIFHTGLRNPKEIAFNEVGDGFSVDNNADMNDKARLVYLVDGGDSGWRTDHQNMHTFHREIGMEQRPPNIWMDDRMWDLQNESQPAWLLPPLTHISAGPSGLAFQPGTALGGKFASQFFICDYKGGAAASGIWAFGVEPTGASYQIVNPHKFIWGIGATDIDFGYDGKAYICDFVTGWKSAQQGRVVTLETPEAHPQAAVVATLFKEGFSQRSDEELVSLLAHPDMRVRLRAQYTLAKRPQAIDIFAELLAPAEDDSLATVLPTLDSEITAVPVPQSALPADDDALTLTRLHALWGLWMIERLNHSERAAGLIIASLKDPSAELRAQAARALGEAPLQDHAPLIEATTDPSPRVRFHTALALGRQRVPAAFEHLLNLAMKADEANDPYLRHSAVVGLSGCSNPTELTSLSSHALPSARMVALLALRRLGDPGVANFLFDANPRVRQEAIRIIHDTPIEAARPALPTIADDFLTNENTNFPPLIQRRLLHSLFRLGTTENASRILAYAKNERVRIEERREALRLLEQWTEPFPVDQSLGRHAPLPPRPLTEIRPLIESDLADLIAVGSPLTTEAIAIIARYHLLPKSLTPEQLTALVQNATLPTPSRSIALDILAKNPKYNASELLNGLIQNNNEPAELRATALTLLSKHNPETSLPFLHQALASENQDYKKQALGLLATRNDEASAELLASLLQGYRDQQGDPQLLLEVLHAAQARKEEIVQVALEDYQISLPLNDPLAPFYACLEGGNADQGKALFDSHPASQCARCHIADPDKSAANMAGPHLAGVGRKDRRELLQSLVRPSDVITAGFAPISLTLSNGETLSGIQLEKTTEHIDLLSNGEAIRVATADIASASEPTSPMPAMGTLLSTHELRDIVAYLATLVVDANEKKPLAPNPKPYHPSPAPENTHMAEDTTTPAAAPAGIDPAVMDLGKTHYETPASCITCHQADGKGIPQAFPPLAASEWVTGPVENLIRIQLRGLSGEIEVAGQKFNSAMAPMSHQTDEQIAAVLTYVRNSFGNSGSAVTPEQVSALRSEVGQPMLTVADLVSPTAAPAEISTDIPAASQLLTALPNAKMPSASALYGFPAPLFTGLMLLLILGGTIKFLFSKK